MKYLILNFRDAKLFKAKGRKKFRSYQNVNVNGKWKVQATQLNSDAYDEGHIKINHISNVLHVLFGERPVPKRRNVNWEVNEYLLNKAKESYIKLDTYIGEKGFISENIQTNKEAFDNKSPIVVLNKLSFEDYICYSSKKGVFIYDDSNFKRFKKLLSEYYNIDYDNSNMEDIVSEIYENPDIIPHDLLIFKGKTPISNLFKTGVYEVSVNSYGNKSAMPIYNGFDKIDNISGSILVPVTDEDIVTLSQNKGVATLLDGGLVYIDKIIDEENIDPEGLVKIEEL